MTVIPVSTTDQLWTASLNAAAGDVIECAAGTYGPGFYIPGNHTSPFVTIRPQSGAAVIFDGFEVAGNGYIIDGIDFARSAATQYCLTIGGHDVTVKNCLFHTAGDALYEGAGTQVRNTSNITIMNCEFRYLGAAGSGLNVDNFVLKNNNVHNIGTDGFLNLGVRNSTVQGNTFHTWNNAGGGHPDAIQFASDGNEGTPEPIPSSNVLIDSNRVERGGGDQLQGIFVEDGTGFTVTNNVLMGTLNNGISFARTHDVTIEHNFLQAANEGGLTGTDILIRQEADNVTITDNTIAADAGGFDGATAIYVGVNGENQPTNVTVSGNHPVVAAADGDYTQVNIWLGLPPVVVPPPVPPVVPPPPLVPPPEAPPPSSTTVISGSQVLTPAIVNASPIESMFSNVFEYELHLGAIESVQPWTGDADRSTKNTGSVTAAELAKAFKALTDDLRTRGVIE